MTEQLKCCFLLCVVKPHLDTTVCLSVCACATIHPPTEIQGREVRRHPQVEAAQPELGGLSPQDHQSRRNRVSHHCCRGNAVPDRSNSCHLLFFLLRHTGVLRSCWHTHKHKQTHICYMAHTKGALGILLALCPTSPHCSDVCLLPQGSLFRL